MNSTNPLRSLIPGISPFWNFFDLENRRGHLHYRAAIEAQLPIGSGLIESGHRHLLQSRLKRAGAWWLWDNAKAIANLRVLRQNGLWDAYWAQYSAA